MVDSSANWEKPIDIFAIGFEEIVDLNASNIMKARYLSFKWLYEICDRFCVLSYMSSISEI